MSTLTKLLARLGRCVLLVLITLLPALVHAVELSDLKSDGVVGERADGYLGLVQNTVDADAAALVAAINAKRKAEYQRIAAANELPLEKVEALAGKKTLGKTESGHWIFIESWRQK